MKKAIDQFLQLAEDYREEAIGIRRYLHQHPEIAGCERETTAYIKRLLLQSGIEVIDDSLETGLIARVNGKKTGKNICIRVEIDALPMKEKSGLPFASINDNACHSCGHDLHMAAALTCARILQETRDCWSGNVGFIFQPAEETGEGAKYMMSHHVLERLQPDVMIGFHCWPELPAGSVGVRKGPMMAASDSIRIKITGKSGHAAHPHKCIDPILISSYVIQQLQNIVSRQCDPVEAAVITIGKISGGTADNAIPAVVELEGTARSLRPEDRIQIQKAVTRIVEHTAAAMGGSGEVTIEEDRDPLICDDTVASYIEEAAACVAAGPVVQLQKPSMGMEDFSYYLRGLPGAYFRVGSANEQAATRLSLHNPEILFDEGAILTACKVLLQFTALYDDFDRR